MKCSDSQSPSNIRLARRKNAILQLICRVTGERDSAQSSFIVRGQEPNGSFRKYSGFSRPRTGKYRAMTNRGYGTFLERIEFHLHDGNA
jgi:hypothetical protein